MAERIFNHPYSLELELAFLSSRMVRSLSRASFADEDRRIFSIGAVFFTQALKGIEAVETLRVTPTAAEDIKIYRWGLKILSTLELGKDVMSREEIRAKFSGFKNILDILQHPVSSGTAEVSEQQVQEVITFFNRMRELAKEPKHESIDRVSIRPFAVTAQL